MALTIAEKQPMPGVTVYNVANKTDHMAYYDSMEELDSPSFLKKVQVTALHIFNKRQHRAVL